LKTHIRGGKPKTRRNNNVTKKTDSDRKRAIKRRGPGKENRGQEKITGKALRKGERRTGGRWNKERLWGIKGGESKRQAGGLLKKMGNRGRGGRMGEFWKKNRD